MNDLILHRGATLVSKEELDLIPLPPATDSYTPVSHFELANTLMTVGQDILRDYALIGQNYALARQGNQMFAVLNFKKDNSEMGLSVAFRNSYDRSMSVGLAIGAQVFICDNLALHGEIAVMKKHTKNVWSELENLAIATLYRSQQNFQQIVADSGKLKALSFQDDQAFRMLGLLFGKDILSPRQLPVVKEEWLHPHHPEFQHRNAWSFYNAVTESLKTCPPINRMERGVALHQAFLEEVKNGS